MASPVRNIVKPIYKGIKSYNKILTISKSFPEDLKLNVHFNL